MPSIVQFFHPGGEHGYDKKISNNGKLIKDWNKTAHKRKFLLNEGSYIKNGQKYDGKLLFWGEWEPPSRVEKLKEQTNFPLYGKNPEYLHTPFLPPDDQIKEYQKKFIKNENQEDIHLFQNTDPFVFDDNFIYAICRQGNKKSKKKQTKNNHMRELEKGSLIIFGSQVNYRFVIDTVFVVKEVHKYKTLEDIKQLNLVTHQKIAIDFILDKSGKLNILPEGRTLYKGATFDVKQDEMYSFVPAKVYNDQKIGYPRFFMSDEFYNGKFKDYFQKPDGMMGVRITKNKSIDEIHEFWEYLKSEISKDHVLGYNFKMPKADEDFKYRDKNVAFPSFVNGKSGRNSKSCV